MKPTTLNLSTAFVPQALPTLVRRTPEELEMENADLREQLASALAANVALHRQATIVAALNEELQQALLLISQPTDALRQH